MPILGPKQKAVILVLIILGVFAGLLSAHAFHESCLESQRYDPNTDSCVGGYPKIPGMPQLTKNTTLPYLLAYVFGFAIIISGLIAFGSIVYAGFLYMTSGASPGLRAEAKKRLANTLQGLALLFGIYLILNVINPELVQLYIPGEGPQAFFDPKTITSPQPAKTERVPIDLNSLKYGGVTAFADPDPLGSTGKWEVILSTVRNFSGETWIDSNLDVSALKILGNCNIVTYKNQDVDPEGQVAPDSIFLDVENVTLQGPLKGTLASLGGTNNDMGGLDFPIGGNSCIGHSIKIYENANYNIGVNNFGAHTLIDSHPNLADVDWVQSDNKLEDTISSIEFSRRDSARGITLYNRRNYEEGDADYLTPDGPSGQLNQVDGTQLDNKTSSIRFTKSINRQAGVILFEHSGLLNGRNEIIISSIANIDGGFVDNTKRQPNVSSLKIIGRYKVTLYDTTGFTGNWLEFNIVDPNMPFYNKTNAVATSTIPSKDMQFNVIAVQSLGDSQYGFNDKIKSIKLELPFSIVDAQKLIPTGAYATQCQDSDPSNPQPEPDDLCQI